MDREVVHVDILAILLNTGSGKGDFTRRIPMQVEEILTERFVYTDQQ